MTLHSTYQETAATYRETAALLRKRRENRRGEEKMENKQADKKFSRADSLGEHTKERDDMHGLGHISTLLSFPNNRKVAFCFLKGYLISPLLFFPFSPKWL